MYPALLLLLFKKPRSIVLFLIVNVLSLVTTSLLLKTYELSAFTKLFTPTVTPLLPFTPLLDPATIALLPCKRLLFPKTEF